MGQRAQRGTTLQPPGEKAHSTVSRNWPLLPRNYRTLADQQVPFTVPKEETRQAGGTFRLLAGQTSCAHCVHSGVPFCRKADASPSSAETSARGEAKASAAGAVRTPTPMNRAPHAIQRPMLIGPLIPNGGGTL